MRVHLGSDHAGLDLKDHLLAWLAEHGYEPVDHGPFVYDALDDYPVFCLRAAEAVAAEQRDGLDSLGVVIGGSGNGEQIAANKVIGVRAALVWSEQTAVLAREHNDANVVSVGDGRALARRHDPLRRGVPRPRSAATSGVRRIAQIASYEDHPRAPAAAGVRPRWPGRSACGRCLRGTPSTGSPGS